MVEGRLSIRSYESKEGEKRKATEVVCSNMQMLDRKGGGGEGGGGSYERSAPPARNGAAPASGGSSFDDDAALEDEIPF